MLYYFALATKQNQPFSVYSSIMSNESAIAALTSSALLSIIPLIIYTASSLIKFFISYDNRIIASATIFAATTLYVPLTLSVRLP